MDFFATAARGTGGALGEELRELGLAGVRSTPGGAHFHGGWSAGWKACLHSRIALSVIACLAEAEVSDPDALYEAVRSVDWTPFLTPSLTLAVSAVCRDSRMRHSGFVALRTKDAVVDQLRSRLGTRPSVDREDPDVRIFVRLVRDRAVVGVDLAGASLHRRGYRAATGAAPLRETLAAAMLRMAGWDRRTPLLDPMCGAGSLAIEAALWAGKRAPGRMRARFGFERWAMHDAACAAEMADLRAAADAAAKPAEAEVVAGDADAGVLDRARAAARSAGVAVRFYRGAVERDMPRFAGPAMLVTNPPYGRRLAGGDALYAALARAFRGRSGDTVALLCGNPALADAMGCAPAHQWELSNGDLPCRLLVYRF